MCAYRCAQLKYTTQQRAVQTIFRFISRQPPQLRRCLAEEMENFADVGPKMQTATAMSVTYHSVGRVENIRRYIGRWSQYRRQRGPSRRHVTDTRLPTAAWALDTHTHAHADIVHHADEFTVKDPGPQARNEMGGSKKVENWGCFFVKKWTFPQHKCALCTVSAVAPPGGKGGSFPPIGGRPKIM